MNILITYFVIALISRTVAKMINYCLSYGQLFGWVKQWLAGVILPDSKLEFSSPYMSENEERSIIIYDQVCEVKNQSISITKIILSYIFSLLDCVYCIGFWVAIAIAFSLYLIGFDWLIIVINPIFTFLLIEKI